MYWISD